MARYVCNVVYCTVQSTVHCFVAAPEYLTRLMTRLTFSHKAWILITPMYVSVGILSCFASTAIHLTYHLNWVSWSFTRPRHGYSIRNGMRIIKGERAETGICFSTRGNGACHALHSILFEQVLSCLMHDRECVSASYVSKFWICGCRIVRERSKGYCRLFR